MSRRQEWLGEFDGMDGSFLLLCVLWLVFGLLMMWASQSPSAVATYGLSSLVLVMYLVGQFLIDVSKS